MVLDWLTLAHEKVLACLIGVILAGVRDCMVAVVLRWTAATWLSTCLRMKIQPFLPGMHLRTGDS